MRVPMHLVLSLIFAVCLVRPATTNVAPPSSSPAPDAAGGAPASAQTKSSGADLSPQSRRALNYLWAQFNPDPEVRLLRESPTVAPNNYWLTTDNKLAAYVLTRAGEFDHAAAISITLRAWGDPQHGLIEALWGAEVASSPHVEAQSIITTTARGEVIRLEERLTGAVYEDWAEYADLALYGALIAWNRSDVDAARQDYATALAHYDGVGFADWAYMHPLPGQPSLYATYKLALALHVARVIGIPEDARLRQIREILLALQAPPCTFDENGASYNGGFYTLYDRDTGGGPIHRGDPNTETTAYAVLALLPPSRQYLPLILSLPSERTSRLDWSPRFGPSPRFGRSPAEPTTELTLSIQAGLAFLSSLYDPEVELLRESPAIHWDRYYLNNSNELAAYVLETLGGTEERMLAAKLRASLAAYGYRPNGFIEVAWGETIQWPPKHHEDKTVLTTPYGCVLDELHPGPGYFSDWSGFSNLAFMAVLNEQHRGYDVAARRLYEIEMGTFDGLGWPDLAYDRRAGVYETIGPAWALLAGATIGAPVDVRVVNSLLAQQDPATGGFHTHYRPGAPRLADPNVETTGLAILALNAYRGQR